MSNEFMQIEGASRSLHLQVAREIARGILSGSLPQGSIIPGELDLCEQFGVSRTALREAIKLLNSKGLLESRPKIGTRVRDREYWNFLDSQLLDWMMGLSNTEQAYQEFLALRRAIEPEAAALAARNATAEQRMGLSAVFQQMFDVATGVDEDTSWTDVDMEFHRLVFLSTGNSFYIPFANVLRTMFIGFIDHSSKEGGTCIDEHKAIYDAIMAGNAEKAREANLALLNNSNHRLPSDNAA
ncbi:GntR family transcriptional regulator [Agarivorans sp. OAG1]|uniref:Transcriptional regulator n=1 Tax=Agarivorans albus MKT 106 TaxID=1331007 RepID=R9PSA5_AGAAL|nr:MULTISPECIES: FadR/GntR family transcriptional regulator [Agarivorans]MPW29424.1 FCD domain-containing protein [Agarivorans sp. B2Z047]UQN45014.1 FadR family transcriptional regulator [Agarivorans sp. B2Z047]BEU03657.1 GntR family transcriptional regulator [Agarivorans sp. OAG1]GAD04234.1 transcriptional regulator [Agarivorans albus MKT 106]